ncbi:MAG: DsrE family protein [Euryarchaeota archaeon]
MDSVLLIIDKAPYGWEDAFSGFYVAIACLNIGLPGDVLLTGDGVYAALEGQDSESNIGFPSVEELTYLIFPEGNVMVHGPSLESRGFTEEDLVESSDLISEEELYEFLASRHKTAFIRI